MLTKNLTIKEIFTLANQNYKKNNFKSAEKLYKEILKKNPNHFDSVSILGLLSAQLGKLEIAKQLFQKAIQINPNYPNVYYNLGLVFKELGEYQKAVSYYKKAIKLKPNYYLAHNNLGIVFYKLGEFQKAKKCYEQAIQIKPDFVNAHFGLGNVFEELGEYQKAINYYKKTIQIQPDHIEAHNNLALVFKSQGEYQKAIACYEDATKYQSENLVSIYLLSELKKEVLDFNLKKKIINIINKESCTKINYVYGNFLLSKYELKKSNYEKEFSYLLKTHSHYLDLRKFFINKEVDYWLNRLPKEKRLINLKKSNKNFQEDNKIKPIFIVGIPRCGSTLIEKIIASSTKFIPIGEETNIFRDFVKQIINQNSFLNTNIKDTQTKIIKEFEQKGLIQANSNYIFTDKSLDNFFYLGLINKIFPNAKVINCKRNFLSSIMSIFKGIYKDIPWGHNLEHIFKYINIYNQMINNSKNFLPDFIYDLEYEVFVENPEVESKKLLEFCNLPWDKKCLEFYKRKDIISKTASSLQIKKAIYKDSGEKYLRYKKFLYKYGKQYAWFN